MIKIFVNTQEEINPGEWKNLGEDDFKVETEERDPEKLLQIAQTQVDSIWNNNLRHGEKPRRATEFIRWEHYELPTPKKNWDNYDPFEDDLEDWDQEY